MSNFPHTRAALEAWSRGQARRQALWDAADDPSSVFEASQADLAALRLVQDGFHQDTAQVNDLLGCQLVSLKDLQTVVDGVSPAQMRRTTDAPLRAALRMRGRGRD